MNRNEPRQLTEPKDRMMARQIRDRQWRTLELVAEHNPLYICWWDKAGRHRHADPPPNLLVSSPIDSNQLIDWLKQHPDWTEIGEWSETHYAAPVYITDPGRAALLNREQYDLEPVQGGMVEPGWTCIPAPAMAQKDRPAGDAPGTAGTP